MDVRTATIGWLLLTLACGPGAPDDTGATGGDSTSGGTTTGGTTTTSGTSGTGGSSTGASTGTPTTGTTSITDTSAGTTGTSGGTTTGTTTGPPTCEAIVGSEDCAALAEVSPDLSLEECLMCQGAACGQIEPCDAQYPCVEGVIVLRGCCTDDQCEGLAPFCGMFIATNNVCVESDDI